MINPPANIGLLGGSYDPVHNGHVSIAESFSNSPFIDQLWILLTPSPPHKKKQTFTAYHHRLNMLEVAFDANEHITISTVEEQIDPPQYTYKTVEYLTVKYPKINFSICLGEDGYAAFDSWYKYEKLLDRCDLLVARRPGCKIDIKDHDLIKEKAHFVDHNPIAVSSTCVRDKIDKGEEISEYVPEDVAEYIKTHQLYQR